jgi:hypothetical protein
MSWAGNIAAMGEMRKAHTVLVGKPEGKRPLWRARCSEEGNTGVNLKYIRV